MNSNLPGQNNYSMDVPQSRWMCPSQHPGMTNDDYLKNLKFVWDRSKEEQGEK